MNMKISNSDPVVIHTLVPEGYCTVIRLAMQWSLHAGGRADPFAWLKLARIESLCQDCTLCLQPMKADS